MKRQRPVEGEGQPPTARKGQYQAVGRGEGDDAADLGARGVHPAAVARLLPSNQMAISFGAPMEIIGPPKPNIATNTNIVSKPVAIPRSRADRPMKRMPIPSDLRSPMRSMVVRPGTPTAI